MIKTTSLKQYFITKYNILKAGSSPHPWNIINVFTCLTQTEKVIFVFNFSNVTYKEFS